jgi:beta-lactamase regulating signal transducer with metallopeptidase domain/protocatechuate 3,4-dioxygenase beta subunit
MPRWLIDYLATGGPALVVADAVAKATILLCLTTAIAGVLRRSAAAVRHRLWGLTLCGLIVLPFLSWSVPGWRLSVLPTTMGLPSSAASRNEGAAELGSDQAVNAGSPDGTHSTQPHLVRSSPVVQFLEAPGASLRESAWIMLLWVLGFIAVALPALAGVAGNEWRRRQSRRVVDQNWLQLLNGLARQFTLRRRVELRTSPVPLIPVTWGVLRPVVLLPEQAQQWPEPARRLVLLHELAHIKRCDVGFQLIGRLATAVYWFHPLAWYALHRLRAECECACDDHVVHLGVRRTDYARQLVDLARSLRPAGLTAAVPLTRKNTLEQRIKVLFDDGRSHRLLGNRPATGLLAGALVLMTGLAAVHPGTSEVGQLGIAPAPAPAATTKPARDEQKTVTPAAVAPAPEKSPVARPEESLPKTYTHPITVSGRALNPAGKPISGARMYLASLRADSKRIAETTTDAEGRYEFHKVPLPIERANTVSGQDMGSFQVFGQAEGLGFAWRPQKWFFLQPKPANITYEPEQRDPPSHYEAKDTIVLDLNFSPPARLSGTIVDDRGNPLADVRLEIRDCESLSIVDDIRPGWTFATLNQRDSAPPSMKIRTTDAQGRFEFTGLPVDCRFRIDLRAKGFPSRWVYAATTRAPQPDHDGSAVLTGDVKVTLATPLDVPVKIVFGDTGEPAPKVAVSAAAGLGNTLQTTDNQGRVTLRIPPGRYRTQYLPARGTPYLVTEGDIVVGAKPPAEPVVATLRPAGVIEVTVLDAETGAGIPDVDLWRQTGPNGGREVLFFRSWEVATRIAWVERPRTDARGKLRALVEPGTHRLGVGFQAYPLSHEVVESAGQEVECRAGKPVQLKFTMRKRR